MLYPPELRGRIQTGDYFVVSQVICYHLLQIRVKPTPMIPTRRLPVLLLLFAACYASGCAATPNLSVQLVHPKTNVVQNCTARESTARDIPLLSAAVEACARQLEARGFIRVESSLTPSEQSNR